MLVPCIRTYQKFSNKIVLLNATYMYVLYYFALFWCIFHGLLLLLKLLLMLQNNFLEIVAVVVILMMPLDQALFV